jgi:anti-anti-sigma factor
MTTVELLAVEFTVNGDEAQLAVDGELDMCTAHIVEESVDACVSQADVRSIEVDLRGVSFCDAAGLRALVRSRRSAADRRLSCTMWTSPAIRRVAEAAGYRSVSRDRC